MDAKLVLGGPGCGKTTRLLQIMEQELSAGVPAHRIAYVAFTNAAADEAKNRAASLFQLDPAKDLPYFRTIHSLAYHSLHLNRDEIMGWSDWRRFGQMMGELIRPAAMETGSEFDAIAEGNRMLYVIDFARTTMRSLQATHQLLDVKMDWWHLHRFAEGLNAFKKETGKIDFTDMLIMYLQQGEPVPVTVAIVDEAQDLTPAQWRVVARAFAGVERIYFGGDDDQAIYTWAGADVRKFLRLKGSKEVLQHSHRLPRSIFQLSQRVVHKIHSRYKKNHSPSDRDGQVQWYRHADTVPIDTADGSWLLLARNRYLLNSWIEAVRSLGYPYMLRNESSVKVAHVVAIRAWERLRKGKTISAAEVRAIRKVRDFDETGWPALNDARRYSWNDLLLKSQDNKLWHECFDGIAFDQREYYISCLRNGQRLTQPPIIRIDTIHGVKGGEADNVAMLTDISFRTAAAMEKDPDNEHRVFYVGVTRARHSLHLVEPQGPNGYSI